MFGLTLYYSLFTSEPKGEILYNMLRPWIGEGLLVSKGQKWARNRQLLTPAFHFEILKTYLEVKNRCADQLLVRSSFHSYCQTSFFSRTFKNKHDIFLIFFPQILLLCKNTQCLVVSSAFLKLLFSLLP